MATITIIRELEKLRNGRTWGELAIEIGCTQSHLSEVIHGKRPPGPKIQKFLRVVRKVVYVKQEAEA